MSDNANSPDTPAVATPKKSATSKVKKPKAKANHPPASEMVNEAIESLREKNGSSLRAIKNYIAANYKVDVEKHAPFIKKYLKAAVANENLVQTKGKGAAGSFKLPVKKTESKSKTRGSATPKSAVAKKAVAEKKRAPKVAAKPPKAKSTTAKPKAAPKKAKASASPKKKAAPKAKKTAAKK